MVKMLGATLIILAATLAGWHKAGQYANRPRQIRHLIVALKRLETEITYGFTPLPEALRVIARGKKSPIQLMFEHAASGMDTHNLTAQESLHLAISKYWGYTAMKVAEQEIMQQLSYTLGTSDREDQAGHIAAAISQLQHEELQARDEQGHYEKMCKSLGLLSGILIVILLY
ncbi:stage III sporulation protein SpoAB [compost metagenome]